MKFELGGVHLSFLASGASVSGSAFYKLLQRFRPLL